MDRNDLFEEKRFLMKTIHNIPIMFFKSYEKLAFIFFVFCLKLQAHKVLKLSEMIFFTGKNLVVRVFCQKGQK